MELTSILGVIIGFAAVIGAMIFKHIDFGVLYNPAAFFVIFVGTVACIMNSFPSSELKNIGKLFKIIFSKGSTSSKVDTIELIEQLASDSRKDGLLSLEGKIDTLDNEFLKKGLRMIIDGATAEYITQALTIEMEEIEERHSINASIFSQAGAYAPTLGVLGAVFGLIAAMSSIDDMDAMSAAIAAAFIATILGIFTGYVLWNPFANKLKIKSKHEMHEKRMILEGVLSIQNGESPAMIKDKLMSFMSTKERLDFPDKEK